MVTASSIAGLLGIKEVSGPTVRFCVVQKLKKARWTRVLATMAVVEDPDPVTGCQEGRGQGNAKAPHLSFTSFRLPGFLPHGPRIPGPCDLAFGHSHPTDDRKP